MRKISRRGDPAIKVTQREITETEISVIKEG